MHTIQPQSLLLVLVAALALLSFGLAWALAQTRREPGRRSRARNAAAQAGEDEALALLADWGFTVVDTQVRVEGTLWVEGEPEDFEVRLDALVERDGERFVAEVKTGDRAADPAWPATRRQLREYAALMPHCGVLLVCVERGEILEIEFDERQDPPG